MSAVGCGDTTDPGDVALSSIRIAKFDAMSFRQAALEVSTHLTGIEAAIDPDKIASLTVIISRIDYLPADAAEGDESDGGWQSLTLDADATLDLAALPAEGTSPIVIASGSVPVGDYKMVRLFVDSASIVFTGPLSIGQAASFDGDTEYEVTVPSGTQTGIKTDATFSVNAGDTGEANAVDLLFDPDATFGNVSATGSGKVTLSPVLRTRP